MTGRAQAFRERMRDAFEQLLRRTRNAVRQRFAVLIPPGEYRFADSLDSDGQGLLAGGP